MLKKIAFAIQVGLDQIAAKNQLARSRNCFHAQIIVPTEAFVSTDLVYVTLTITVLIALNIRALETLPVYSTVTGTGRV